MTTIQRTKETTEFVASFATTAGAVFAKATKLLCGFYARSCVIVPAIAPQYGENL